ncbi:phosphatase PAP2 family protein [Paludibacterium purpuratum]|uniref:Undecaprenyl-diphosphatase n=1 Tax=Paludibacterium purpuratum TaxID=1144873 RepID=A0A4R7B0L3_9NEIS|nr:phosphatase PAP2 family protein [Paludibacterium purpuratum]TDR76468.1 undecaprenyl-diphosphatase [Paludibacterium purpuratum]
MESLNQALFLWMNAPAQPDPFLLSIATLCADKMIWIVPVLLVVGWLRGSDHTRRVFLVATTATLLALSVNQLIGLVWPHPRPFMIGLGHSFLPHAADSSFPSDHMTVMCSMAFSLLYYRGFRLVGGVLAVLAIPVAWARIYLGVHFPLDMAGALAVSACAAWLAASWAFLYLPSLFRFSINLHRLLFARLIAGGWVQH